jgi:inorganic pyrophosphatase
MRDDKGVDDKLFGVAADDPRYETVQDLNDVSPHVLKEISHFFGQYKELEGKSSVIGEWKGSDVARSLLQESQSRCRLNAAAGTTGGRPTPEP